MTPPARQFQFLRINRPGPGGQPVNDCSLLDVSGFAGDPVALSSFITSGLSNEQADRLEALFRSAGVAIRYEIEKRSPAADKPRPSANRQVTEGNPARKANEPEEPDDGLFSGVDPAQPDRQAAG